MSDTIPLSAAPAPTARVLADAIRAARAEAAAAAGAVSDPRHMPAAAAIEAVGDDPGTPDLARSEQISVAVAALLVRYAEVMAGLADA